MVAGLSIWWVLAGLGVWLLALAFVMILFTAASKAETYELSFRRLIQSVGWLGRLESPSGKPFFPSEDERRQLAREIYEVVDGAFPPKT